MSRPREHWWVRDGLSWLIEQGPSRAGLAYGTRRGDTFARLQTDPALREDPFPAYEELRAQGTIFGSPLRATASHPASTEILRSEQFGVGGGHGELAPRLRRLLFRLQGEWSMGPMDPPSMLATDPPDHNRYHRAVSRSFTVRAVKRWEDQIRELAARLLDGLVEGSSGFDLVGSYASRLPVAVISDMFGVPDEMHDQLLEWGDGAALTLDPGLPWRDFRRARRAVREMHAWVDRRIQQVRRDPGDDLLSQLASITGDDRMSDLELRQTVLLVIGAGFETTVNLIGNAVRLLSEHPGQREQLVADPGLWPGAVEETLRYDSPVQFTMREAYADTEVRGVPVEQGTPVLMLIGAANRDPEVFDEPQRFDIRRENAGEHLAFSSGVHYCLGATLARRETAVALETLYERFPDLSVSGTPVRRETRVLRGYRSLPVMAPAPRGRGRLARSPSPGRHQPPTVDAP